MTIEGVPEGWELVAIRMPKCGESAIDCSGKVFKAHHDYTVSVFPIIRKIEKPKRYRPFANAEEFKPFRDRWTLRIDYDSRANSMYPPRRYNDGGYDGRQWPWCFENFKFDDGTPFGIEVTE